MIALDLDNTLICTDGAFEAAARELDLPLPAGVPVTKALVKPAALAAGGNELWTRLQGIAYGDGLVHAVPFPGCRDFIAAALDRGESLAIVSHKTRYPAIGPRVNLHQAADAWLDRHDMRFDGRLPAWYCESRADKVVRLGALAPRALVDDLPEVFQCPGFPPATAFILFDPGNRHADWTATPRATSWTDVSRLLFPPPAPDAAAQTLLEQIGIRAPAALLPLPGGRNNKVWKVEAAGGPFLLKQYYWSEDDPRDRLGQEWAFLAYLRESGCRLAPRPLARDPAARLALLEFIPGAPPPPAEIGPREIDMAAEFLLEMNAARDRAGDLPPVSEACFSLAEHLAVPAARLERLATVRPESEVHAEAVRFIADLLRPLWGDIDARIRGTAAAELDTRLPPAARCLSPSDFGFHNALRQADGSLRFLDFEYAGWDDPAKTLIDFCNQPDFILPDALAARFLDRCLPALPAPDALAVRFRLLEPLYQFKWACICLNLFLPGRRFTDPRPERAPAAQLARARAMAARARKSLDSLPSIPYKNPLIIG